MRENARDDGRFGDEPNDARLTTAARAELDVHRVHSPQQLGPASPARSQRGPDLRTVRGTRRRTRRSRQSHHPVLRRVLGKPGVGRLDLLVDALHHREQRSDLGAQSLDFDLHAYRKRPIPLIPPRLMWSTIRSEWPEGTIDRSNRFQRRWRTRVYLSSGASTRPQGKRLPVGRPTDRQEHISP